jgi:hypothetical protein
LKSFTAQVGKDRLAEGRATIENQRRIIVQYEHEKADEALEDTDCKDSDSEAGSDSDHEDLYATDYFILRAEQSEGLCKEIERLQASYYSISHIVRKLNILAFDNGRLREQRADLMAKRKALLAEKEKQEGCCEHGSSCRGNGRT